jgi:hypothetical protein
VVNGALLEKIAAIFTTEEKLDNKIEVAFEAAKFKLSNNTFLVFHNCKFEKLKNGLNKQKVQLKGQNDKKEVLLISTLPTLSFDSAKLTTAIQREVEAKAAEEANEKVEFKLIGQVVYVKCPSTITAVYLYFYLHHTHALKGTFEKIPQGTANKSKLFKNTRNARPAGRNDRREKGSNYQSERDNDFRYGDPEVGFIDEEYHEEYSDEEFDDDYNRPKQYSPKKNNKSHENSKKYE